MPTLQGTTISLLDGKNVHGCSLNVTVDLWYHLLWLFCISTVKMPKSVQQVCSCTSKRVYLHRRFSWWVQSWIHSCDGLWGTGTLVGLAGSVVHDYHHFAYICQYQKNWQQVREEWKAFSNELITRMQQTVMPWVMHKICWTYALRFPCCTSSSPLMRVTASPNKM